MRNDWNNWNLVKTSEKKYPWSVSGFLPKCHMHYKIVTGIYHGGSAILPISSCRRFLHPQHLLGDRDAEQGRRDCRSLHGCCHVTWTGFWTPWVHKAFSSTNSGMLPRLAFRPSKSNSIILSPKVWGRLDLRWSSLGFWVEVRRHGDDSVWGRKYFKWKKGV